MRRKWNLFEGIHPFLGQQGAVGVVPAQFNWFFPYAVGGSYHLSRRKVLTGRDAYEFSRLAEGCSVQITLLLRTPCELTADPSYVDVLFVCLCLFVRAGRARGRAGRGGEGAGRGGGARGHAQVGHRDLCPSSSSSSSSSDLCSSPSSFPPSDSGVRLFLLSE